MSDPALDEHGRPLYAHDALNTVRKHVTALVDGRKKPYDAGRKISEAAFDGSFCKSEAPDPEHCKALWLLWGALTDWVEMKPEETAEAEQSMRRAAVEWLEVADEEPRWRDYFEQWLYVEIGYSRPAKDSPAAGS